MSQTRKVKIRWRNVIIAAVALILVLYLLITLIGALFRSATSDRDSFTACNLSASRLRKQVTEKEYESSFEIGDFVYYGEYLSLYSGEYSRGSSSNLTGKTMILRDVCSGKEVKIDKVGSVLDQQIDLRTIPEGFYEVYVIENLLEKRVYTKTAFPANEITTVTRNGQAKHITLYGDASLFNKKDATENALDRNYVFLDVRKAANDNTVYDVVLNPGPVTATNYENLEGNGLKESDEMYRFTVAVANKLQEAGYKVLITRGEYDWAGMFGPEGIAAKAYNSKAKYFISFDMYDGTPLTGIRVVYSSFIDEDSARTIFNTLVNEGGMSGQNGNDSVVASKRDGGYDEDYDIRETGGKALGAGTLSGESEKNTFAVNANGLESLYFRLCNIKIAEDAEAWKTNFDTYVSAMAHGIELALTPQE